MDWTTLILMAIVIIIVICWFLHILWGARIMNKLTADRDLWRRKAEWLADALGQPAEEVFPMLDGKI